MATFENDLGDFDRFARTLSRAGLNRLSVIGLSRLDPALAESIREAAGLAGLDADPGVLKVVVVGNGGGGIWECLSDGERAGSDPLDSYSAARVREALATLPAPARSVLVYPGDCGFSLLALGSACGWGVPSWLGVHIHARLGTWFAFRAVAVTTAALPDHGIDEPGDACLRCPTRDCVTACAVDAPGPPGSFDLDACMAFRLGNESPCAYRCLARESCPVGSGLVYPRGLVAHVYGRSLDSLRRHVRGRSAREQSGRFAK